MLPPAPPPTTPMTHVAVEKIVEEIMERQQQQLQQQQQQQPTEQKKKQTKTCLACGQPKSRYENDGSSIHFFYQQGPVRYFYCSTKVFTTYSAEGLTNQRMPFQDFMETEFFQRELEATKKRVEEKGQQKRKRSDTQPQPTGRLCRFCKMELKKGPNSPHVHTGFPGDRSGRTGSEVEREKGVGSGRVLEPGIELGTPVAQRRCMSAHCPQGYRRRLHCMFNG
ncbi:hypothetical protein Q8A67_007253 [Cirrhinus molitorella]|uniref:Uncharacterized protein n=1 Tax=Cirrhinus molitorella TaxID=172907 RepID=A0AA88TRK3_9TELE|nr:hypothetical protein Q8A67_007253 [Cirrhinus molitorella]